ncbi:uncharacterized protein LOC113296494 [Papaver somniferum]|uniref:uncharacterized protein LOC113296494 n=1 Tax=Papaver somniferum TaxID=3469 RepID=UPI000E704714|nr:uncharacterized protein LOC113296494 [Papaver somniferum]
MIRKVVLIHYNGEWVHKEGNDDYKDMWSPKLLHNQIWRVKVDIPPVTPKTTTGDYSGSKMLPHTPLTPLNNLTSCSSEDYQSKNETIKGDGGVKVTFICPSYYSSTSGPKARRCLEPVMTPSAKKLQCLHDATTTPAPVLDIPKPPKDMKYNDLRVGNTFKIKGELKLILAIAKVERNFEYKAFKSDSQRFIAKCKDKTCEWRVREVPLDSCGWWKLTVANDVHTCESNKRTDPELRTKAATTGITELFKHKFKELYAAFTPKQLVKDVKRDYGVVINYRQGYKACKRGIELIKGSPDESYQYLVGCSHILGARKKGTVTEIVTDSDDSFLYYFFAFGVCIKGFKNCFRPAFAVDGTHLIGPRQGVLLSSVGMDPDESIYPISFAVVDSENNEFWEWFMRKLVGVLGDKYTMNEDVVVATDRHPSISRAIRLAFPCANQVYCIHHLSENIKQTYYSAAASVAFTRAAKAFSNDKYELAMRDLGLVSPSALKSVVDLGTEMWARVKARTCRFTLMTTNACETFNLRIADVKGLQICHLVDYIRRFHMEWFCERRQLARDWQDPLSQHARDIIKERWAVEKRFVACHVDGDEYEVDEGDYEEHHTIYLDRRSCTCKVFDYQHLPCPHVLAVCEMMVFFQ